MRWDEDENIKKALDGLRDVFQQALEQLGYNYEEDALGLRLDWFKKMLEVHSALTDLDNDHFHTTAKKICLLEKQIALLEGEKDES